MNLSKHVDPVINKRLSSSSATLLNSPDRGTVWKKSEKQRTKKNVPYDNCFEKFEQLLSNFLYIIRGNKMWLWTKSHLLDRKKTPQMHKAVLLSGFLVNDFLKEKL